MGHWANGTPIEESLIDDDYGPIIDMMSGSRDPAERERWRQIREVQSEIDSCERPQWLPLERKTAVDKRRTGLVALIVLPLILVVFIATIAMWIWERFLRRLWLTMPHHMRKGLIRVYAVTSVPWIGWNGLQIASHGPNWRYLPQTFWTMLAVPIGSPLFLILILWIRDGFRKQPLTLDESETISTKPVRSKSKWALEQERRQQMTPYECETNKNPSTAFLVISTMFPGIWIMDVTLMSLFWVARLPKF